MTAPSTGTGTGAGTARLRSPTRWSTATEDPASRRATASMSGIGGPRSALKDVSAATLNGFISQTRAASESSRRRPRLVACAVRPMESVPAASTAEPIHDEMGGR